MRRSLFCCFTLLAVLCTGCHPPDQTRSTLTLETHYAPAENLESLDRKLFASATSTIDLCAYSLTDHLLAQALTEAAHRGVRIRIYLDRGQTSGEMSREARQHTVDSEDSVEGDPLAGSGVLTELAATPNISVRVKHSRTPMHLKSYVVDGAVLRSGSANFSPTGEKRQDNDLTLVRDSDSVRRFSENFERIWNRPDNSGLEAQP